MANKNMNTRIQLKHDTEAHWKLAENFSPRDGEVIIYEVDDSHSFPRMKIGDGTTNVNDLPFLSAFNKNKMGVASNDTESDEITVYREMVEGTYTDGDIVFIFLSKATLGLEPITLSAGGLVKLPVYKTYTTQLIGKFTTGTLFEMAYYDGKFYLINAPIIL